MLHFPALMKQIVSSSLFWLLLSLGLMACGKNFEVQEAPLASPQTVSEGNSSAWEEVSDQFFRVTPPAEKRPQAVTFSDGEVEVETSFRMVLGLLNIRDLTYTFDKSTKQLSLKGRITFKGSRETGGEPVEMPFSMKGDYKDYKVSLSPHEPANLQDRFQAIANCSDQNCGEFYVDFYYVNPEQKLIYTDQFVAKAPVVQKSPETTTPEQTAVETTESQDKDSIVVIEEITPPQAAEQGEALRQQPEANNKENTTQQEPKKDKPAPKDSADKPKQQTQKPSDKKSGDKPERPSKSPKDDEKTILTPIKPNPNKNPQPKEVEEADVNDFVETSKTNQGYASPRIEEVAELFPILKTEKQKAQEKIEEIKKNNPPKKEIKPVVVQPPVNSKKAGPGVLLKPLGNSNKDLPEPVLKILKDLPRGVPQAIETRQNGAVVKRRLDNGVNILPLVNALDPNSGLRMHRLEEKAFFGTSELVSTILRIGQWVLENVGNVTLDLSDLSDKDGGLQYNRNGRVSHASHQHGIDADIGYIFNDSNPGGPMRTAHTNKSKFLLDKQWELFKALFQENTAHLIYVSPEVKKMLCQHVKQTQEITKPETAAFTKSVLERIKYMEGGKVLQGHHNHFHLRVKCGPDQKFCLDTQSDVRPEPCPR